MEYAWCERAIAEAVLVFITMLVVHVITWRALRPHRSIRLLGLLFLGIPSMLFFGATIALAAMDRGAVIENELIAAAAFYLALACAYIQTYPAMQADSPSLVIAYLIGRSGKAGTTVSALEAHFNEEMLVDARIDDLVLEGFIVRSGDHLSLTSKGNALAVIFKWYTAIIGIPSGEG